MKNVNRVDRKMVERIDMEQTCNMLYYNVQLNILKVIFGRGHDSVALPHFFAICKVSRLRFKVI